MPTPVPFRRRHHRRLLPIAFATLPLTACVAAGPAVDEPPVATAATTAGPSSLMPGSDLPPRFDLRRIEAILADAPPPADFSQVDPDPSVPTPASVLGHEIGARFTRHEQMVDWCRRLAEASPRVRLESYGRSTQGRPLFVLVISDPGNLDRLDEILAANARLADPRTADAAARRIAIEDEPAVSWMSFNVHGNEASCMEAAMLVAYRLAAGRTEAVERTLADSVVVIDPCLNPDGHARYVSFFQDRVGMQADPFPMAAEHREPWPSGRPNHYLFDLNRDWVWGTQVESRQRVPLYRRFRPQLHLDVHEQGIHSPYFLGAGDTPYHAEIPEESRDWFEVFGRVMGASFDDRGFEFATRERFDYLYPGYGKVLPVHHGAVGLLLEQAGHGRAGRVITVDAEHAGGYDLTLADRAEHHATACLAAAHATAVLRVPQRQRFARYFEQAMEVADGRPTAWLVMPQTDPGPRAELADLLAFHGIEAMVLLEERTIVGGEGFHPPLVSLEPQVVPAGTWVVPAGQPMGRLARVLLERDPVIEDRDTYDITAWSVPPMFGLDALAVTEAIDDWPTRALDTAAASRVPAAVAADPSALAMIAPSDRRAFARVLGDAARLRLHARLLDRDLLTHDGRRVPAGSLIVPATRNRSADLEAFAAAAAAAGLPLMTVDRTIPAAGPALANNANRRFVTPRRIVLGTDSPFSSLSTGHLRHLLDVRTGIPHHVVRADDLRRLPWHDVDVLVLPETGSLGSALGESGVAELRDWMRGGGTVVAVGRAARWAGRELAGI
ncbi:MAG: M14 family zinc carboxypeptidase, partial [Planctomycetota bacterium]